VQSLCSLNGQLSEQFLLVTKQGCGEEAVAKVQDGHSIHVQQANLIQDLLWQLDGALGIIFGRNGALDGCESQFLCLYEALLANNRRPACTKPATSQLQGNARKAVNETPTGIQTAP
jgi:hypothetical protein